MTTPDSQAEMEAWLESHRDDPAAGMAYSVMRMVVSHIGKSYSGVPTCSRVELVEDIRRNLSELKTK